MNPFFKSISLCLLTLFLVACASAAKRHKMHPEAQYVQGEVKAQTLEMALSPEAQEKLADNAKFDLSEMEDTLRTTLSAAGYLKDGEKNTIIVTIMNIRTRSAFSAIMFGMMAGSDRVAGRVVVVDPEGNIIRGFDISASYALGGTVAGSDDVRMSWLYESFAELTLKELQED